MKLSVRLSVLLAVLACGAVIFMENSAFAQCPPGTHWSNRYWACVPNRRPPPPPPPAYAPPPPPPPVYAPPPGRGCRWSYNNCVRLCYGDPACLTNCNIGYNVCRQQGR